MSYVIINQAAGYGQKTMPLQMLERKEFLSYDVNKYVESHARVADTILIPFGHRVSQTKSQKTLF